MTRVLLFLFSIVSVIFFCDHSGVLAANSTTVQNEEFDSIIEQINKQIVSLGASEVSISSISLSVLTMTNGTFGNFSSLERVGDAEVVTSSSVMSISGTVTFSTLEADFDQLDINLGLLTIGGGSASASFSTNQIDIDIVANLTSCTLTVNEISLTKLSGFTITFGEWTIINWFIELVAPYFFDLFGSTFVSTFGDSLTSVAQTLLGEVSLC